MLTQRIVVGVMGSGAEEHAELAEPLGAWIASSGHDLLTGGGPGVMAAVCRGFRSVTGRRGVAIGVLPGHVDEDGYHAREGYPNGWIDVAVRTHLPLSGTQGKDPRSRNHINVLSSDVVIALPGGAGTASEVELARQYGRPTVLFLGPAGSISGIDPSGYPLARTIDQAASFVAEALKIC